MTTEKIAKKKGNSFIENFDLSDHFSTFLAKKKKSPPKSKAINSKNNAKALPKQLKKKNEKLQK